MLTQINIGCGRFPCHGWLNLDNSPSLKLAKSPLKYRFLKLLGLLSPTQIQNINWCAENEIIFADASSSLPLQTDTVTTIYTSHMVEHLSCEEVLRFLKESRRVLKHNGVLRISVPDLKILVEKYISSGNADEFVEKLHMSPPPLTKLKEKLELLTTGYRHHQWMYDGESLSKLMREAGFCDVTVQPPGKTMIHSSDGLDLYERCDQSVYVEGLNKQQSCKER